MKQAQQHFVTARLIGKFLRGELTPGESEQLHAWIEESEDHRALWNRLTDPACLEEQVQYWKDKDDKTYYWKQLVSEIAEKKRQRSFSRGMMRYAAVLVPAVLICGAGLFLFRHRGQGDEAAQKHGLSDVYIMPRGKVAQLVLASGRVIDLNDSLQESITEKDGTKVRNRASALSYFSGGASRHAAALYNTLITPRGGEYRVVLSDGTRVWLNAASSLRYPTRFTGEERGVYLSGEAYFEVAKDAAHPFIVHADKTDITVLGTRFNVSAYPEDRRQKTTLAEGSVRVNEPEHPAAGNKGVVLKPGYEAVTGDNGDRIQVRKANVEAALAWKNGMFIFDGESLGALMRKLSRWYDVDVKYDKGVDTLFHFTGRIQRYENITGILHLIELTGKIKFGVKGKEVEIMPK